MKKLPLGMTKVPEGWPLMAQAYIDFAIWSAGKPEVLYSFEAETGMKYHPPKCGLDRMIDEATGSNKQILSAFLDWLTVNHWGEEA